MPVSRKDFAEEIKCDLDDLKVYVNSALKAIESDSEDDRHYLAYCIGHIHELGNSLAKTLVTYYPEYDANSERNDDSPAAPLRMR